MKICVPLDKKKKIKGIVNFTVHVTGMSSVVMSNNQEDVKKLIARPNK